MPVARLQTCRERLYLFVKIEPDERPPDIKKDLDHRF